MSRKDRDDSIWLSEHSDKRRIRDAENARQNRAEITKALSHGQIRRRDLVKWGLFTSAGIMLPIGGLNPFVRSAQGQAAAPPAPLSRSAILATQSDNMGIPTGLPASPTFGVQRGPSPGSGLGAPGVCAVPATEGNRGHDQAGDHEYYLQSGCDLRLEFRDQSSHAHSAEVSSQFPHSKCKSGLDLQRHLSSQTGPGPLW